MNNLIGDADKLYTELIKQDQSIFDYCMNECGSFDFIKTRCDVSSCPLTGAVNRAVDRSLRLRVKTDE